MNSFSRALTPPFKIWKVLRYPSYLCLRLTIPVVDEEVELTRGWNQKLHVLQCLLTPIFTVFATNTAFITIKGNIGVVSGVSFHASTDDFQCFKLFHNDPSDCLFGGTKKTLIPELWHLALLSGQTFAILLMCSSKPNRPPRYQPLLAGIGFVVSIVWIYVVANEIVSLLKVS